MLRLAGLSQGHLAKTRVSGEGGTPPPSPSPGSGFCTIFALCDHLLVSWGWAVQGEWPVVVVVVSVVGLAWMLVVMLVVVVVVAVVVVVVVVVVVLLLVYQERSQHNCCHYPCALAGWECWRDSVAVRGA